MVAVAAVVAVVVAAARVLVAAVVVAKMAVVLVSPPYPSQSGPSAIVLIHFVSKLILPKNKKPFLKIHNSETIGHQKVYNYLKHFPYRFQPKIHLHPKSRQFIFTPNG